MKIYTIVYYADTVLTYYGTLEDCMEYAERHCYGCNGSILIKLGNVVVASQPWYIKEDAAGEYEVPGEWYVSDYYKRLKYKGWV